MLLCDQLLTNQNDPSSYLATGVVNGDSKLILDLRLYGQKFAFYYRELEGPFIRQARSWYRSGTFIDVGGSIGLWAVAMGHQAKRSGNTVVTFEPVPHHRKRLCENLRLNGLEQTVEVIGVALGASERTARMNAHPLGAADNAWIDETGAFEVPVRTLDRVSQDAGWSDISFIKIDTEGYDPDVIAGAAETIRQWRPVIFAELLRERMVDGAMQATWDVLINDLGYRCVRLDGSRVIELNEPASWENLFFLPQHFRA